jgi:nitroreductase
MDVIEAIRTRKSIRGYKSTPVSKEILRQILEVALRCPSARNTQPWEIAVVTGEVFNKIKQGTTEALLSGTNPDPDIKYSDAVEGRHKQYTLDSLYLIWDSMGIVREDKDARAKWAKVRISYFGAPAAIILFAESYLDEMSTQFDIGLLTQTICLAALQHGLGTCIMRAPLDYPEVIRKFTGIPKSKKIVITIAIGYPDWDFPANKTQTARESLENITTWYGFD